MINFKIIGLCISALMIVQPVHSYDTTQYAPFTPKYSKDIAKPKCLTSSTVDDVVTFSDCNLKETITNPLQLWKLEAVSNGYYVIKNKSKDNSNTNQCLRTFSQNDQVEMGSCDAAGTPSNYTSMRYWKVIDNNNYAQLQNKYKKEAGKPNCLRTLNNLKAPLMGNCDAQGGPQDYSTMRQWLSDAIPLNKPWGPTGIAYINYKIPNTPQQGFDRISFPIQIDQSPEARGFYYAMQFKFLNGNGAYIGLQPVSKNKGLAIFSVFGSGAEPVASHCTKNADGGAGSSCSKSFELKFGEKYNLVVERDQANNDIWRGFVLDPSKGEKIEIGAWKPRAGSKGLQGNHIGFIEYFPQINSCTKIPYTRAVFDSPIGNIGVVGSLSDARTGGKCKTDVKFSAKKILNAWEIDLSGK